LRSPCPFYPPPLSSFASGRYIFLSFVFPHDDLRRRRFAQKSLVFSLSLSLVTLNSDTSFSRDPRALPRHPSRAPHMSNCLIASPAFPPSNLQYPGDSSPFLRGFRRYRPQMFRFLIPCSRGNELSFVGFRGLCVYIPPLRACAPFPVFLFRAPHPPSFRNIGSSRVLFDLVRSLVTLSARAECVDRHEFDLFPLPRAFASCRANPAVELST